VPKISATVSHTVSQSIAHNRDVKQHEEIIILVTIMHRLYDVRNRRENNVKETGLWSHYVTTAHDIVH